MMRRFIINTFINVQELQSIVQLKNIVRMIRHVRFCQQQLKVGHFQKIQILRVGKKVGLDHLMTVAYITFVVLRQMEHFIKKDFNVRTVLYSVSPRSIV